MKKLKDDLPHPEILKIVSKLRERGLIGTPEADAKMLSILKPVVDKIRSGYKKEAV